LVDYGIQLQIALILSRSLIILVIKYLQVMVHFSAYWCMPSVAMDLFFEELASTNQDVLFLKVDVDEVKVIL
jgi:thiol-disulfide isomerase/thioredoxin